MTHFDQLVAVRLHTIRDLAESGISELTGKTRREYFDADHPGERGKVSGRFGGLNIPELQRSGDSPKAAAQAIRRGRGKVFNRIRAATTALLEREGFSPPRPRAPGKPVIPAHPRLTRKCRYCEKAHTTAQHRFHGAGAFHQTHLFAFNCPRCNRPAVRLHGNPPRFRCGCGELRFKR